MTVIMTINYITLPKPRDVKVARIYLEWNQECLAQKCGVNIYAINSLETGRHNPKKETLEKIASVFLEEGIRFHPEGGFICDKQVVKIYEGEDCYLKVQEDIIRTMMIDNKNPVLYFGSDEKKSTKEVIKNEVQMYKLGIRNKALAKKDDNYFMGELDNYRLIEPKYFTSGITILYGTKVVFSLYPEKTKKKIVLIDDKELSVAFTQQFYNLWQSGTKPKSSVAPYTYQKLIQKNKLK
jgi:DNA-binding XRE family transcriptional regulator